MNFIFIFILIYTKTNKYKYVLYLYVVKCYIIRYRSTLGSTGLLASTCSHRRVVVLPDEPAN